MESLKHWIMETLNHGNIESWKHGTLLRGVVEEHIEQLGMTELADCGSLRRSSHP